MSRIAEKLTPDSRTSHIILQNCGDRETVGENCEIIDLTVTTVTTVTVNHARTDTYTYFRQRTTEDISIVAEEADVKQMPFKCRSGRPLHALLSGPCIPLN
jgi:hypothetical protein